MKKTIYLFIVLFSLTIVSSCDNQLDQQPVSSITSSSFYSNTNDFTQAVTGVYYKLKEYPGQVLWLGEMRSDNIAAVSDGNRDWQVINDFSASLSAVAFINNAWSNNFNGIYNANNVIAALNGSKGDVLSDSLRTRFSAECRFLRAFYYFQLVRLFGKVPLIDSPKTATEVATIDRSPVSDIYDLIISDLEYAVENLPENYPSAEVGRATKYAAEGILGLVYLTRSGPTYDIEGPGLASNEYDKALDLFNDIINSGEYSFLSDYSSIFSYSNEDNAEVIFDVQFMSSSNGTNFPILLVPVNYITSIGISNTYGNGMGTSTFNVSSNLRTSYGATDIRKTFNVQTTYSKPFVKKYLDWSQKGTSGTDWGINFIVLRYTDILLMKAECILHGATGTQSEVDAIVNEVRTRAGLSAVADVTLTDLFEERRKEFLGEGLRWNDLVRSGNAVTIMNAWRTSDNITTIDEIVPNYLIYPVPATQMQTVSGLYTQNPGYN